jgi:uncharacterized protein YndB with AHSA1/START domain
MMSTSSERAAVHLERTIPAPPSQVYRAWLDPRLLARWMAPGASCTVTRAEVDERVGGHYRIWHANAGSDVGGFDCEIAELVPGQRIVFRWGFAGPDRRDGPVFDSVLTVMLREAPGGATALTLVHERLDDLAAALPQVAAKVESGWAFVLDELADLLAGDAAGPGRTPAADLSLPGALELLEHQLLARVGYTGLDGFPRVIPVSFLWRDDRVIICTAPTSPKVAALSARPRVALTIDTEQPPVRALFIRGVASIEVVDGVPGEYLAAAAKNPRTSPEERGQFERQVQSVYKQMARISVEPRWARYYDFTAGRLPEFLLKLTNR